MGGVAASSSVFHAVADPTRRRLLDLLRESEQPFGDLARPFKMTRPAVSQHLRILREAGLVKSRQLGRQRVYRIDPRPLQQVYDWAVQYKQFIDPSGHVWALAEPKDSQEVER